MILVLLVGLALLGALAFWEFYICEGAHLGPGVVIRMYDIAAGRYDRIKDFDPAWETRFVGESASKRWATMTSAGSRSLTPLDWACCMTCRAGAR